MIDFGLHTGTIQNNSNREIMYRIYILDLNKDYFGLTAIIIRDFCLSSDNTIIHLQQRQTCK